MAKLAPEYELVLMLDPEAPDERRDEIAVNARKRIEAGATLKQERSWGLRKMAYEIKQRNEADYRFFRFEQGAGVLDDLDHNLKITDGILRFRIYK
ncbi:MAG TPA: 30S ribosomal protein S6, partial [Solirubrobacterales bacterium]|nr:30S ribosomal protein S6 [Solirubrobacterales bacterium]